MIRSILRPIVLTLAAALVLVGILAAVIHVDAAHAATPTAVTAVTHTSNLVNCEDVDVQPCWTTDDGALYVVLSYAPYASHVVHQCATAGCLGRYLNPAVKGEPRTRPYKWINF